MRVLVTGGAGYIGSHATRELIVRGHEVCVLDNLSRGHKEAVDKKSKLFIGDVGDSQLVKDILQNHQIDVVMHFAAYIEVAESVLDPEKYYNNNYRNTLVLLKAMSDVGVKRLVFSSTAAVYGRPSQNPVNEMQARSPISPYGQSKVMTEDAIDECRKSDGLGYSVLRYFNVAGAHPDGTIGEDHTPESHLVPRVLRSALNEKNQISIFGTDYPTPDGTCVRDYIHIMDLIAAHILAMEMTTPGKGDVFNLGSEKGFSVREVIKACERATNKKLPYTEEGRRSGDPAFLVADSQKARQVLRWQPKYPDIETIINHAWQWHRTHPNGFRSK
ncbi:MAG: UDP-glucose 4-epimerase GalE [Bdellovibrionaceae bacterium]|nr:UDP-glucose 4-epimerase GalE [Pseudobdellovibrionaceae bacterium]